MLSAAEILTEQSSAKTLELKIVSSEISASLKMKPPKKDCLKEYIFYRDIHV
jgi:hypothetical protein